MSLLTSSRSSRSYYLFIMCLCRLQRAAASASSRDREKASKVLAEGIQPFEPERGAGLPVSLSYRRWLKVRMNDLLTSLPQAVELEIMDE